MKTTLATINYCDDHRHYHYCYYHYYRSRSAGRQSQEGHAVIIAFCEENNNIYTHSLVVASMPWDFHGHIIKATNTLVDACVMVVPFFLQLNGNTFKQARNTLFTGNLLSSLESNVIECIIGWLVRCHTKMNIWT